MTLGRIARRVSLRTRELVFLSITILLAPYASAQTATADFEQALAALASADSYPEKEAAAQAIVATQDERALAVLTAFLEGQLYKTRSTDELVYAEEIDGGHAIEHVLTGATEEVGRRDVRRVSINNSLRGSLRGMLAAFGLQHQDPDQRKRAVDTVAESGDIGMIATLETMREEEPSRRVRAAIDTAIGVLKLDSDDRDTQLAAIQSMHKNLSSHVRTKLVRFSNDESFDAEIRQAADEALTDIETRSQFYEIIKTAFFGLSLGSVLVLAAIGLSVTFGIMGVINMAHGELIMLGAYTTYVVQQIFPDAIDSSLLIAVPLAFCVSGLMGIAIERGVVRFLYGRPLETLLATFGISLVLQQAVRTIFSPLNRAVSTPSWMSGSLEIVPGLEITLNRLAIIIFSMIVFFLLLFVLKRTRLGLEMRAVTQNRAMARAMGIRTDRVDALTFGLGAGIAGVAGVALSQLTNVGPNLGQAYIVDSFMVVVFGGVGNIWGTFVSGLTLGLANKLVEPWVGAVMAKILVLVFLIIFIQKRPRGLFPQKGRAAEQ
jgi:urea transport system permease protein